VKSLAFALGLCIAAIGAVGIVAPSELAWIAQRSGTPAAFYIAAMVRVAFGFVFISAAAASRAPRVLRVLGYVIVVAGVVTALTAMTGVGMDRARALIEWSLQQGSAMFRIPSVLLVAIGGFVAYACAPSASRGD
jgi:hypothetical protein